MKLLFLLAALAPVAAPAAPLVFEAKTYHQSSIAYFEDLVVYADGTVTAQVQATWNSPLSPPKKVTHLSAPTVAKLTAEGAGLPEVRLVCYHPGEAPLPYSITGIYYVQHARGLFEFSHIDSGVEWGLPGFQGHDITVLLAQLSQH